MGTSCGRSALKPQRNGFVDRQRADVGHRRHVGELDRGPSPATSFAANYRYQSGFPYSEYITDADTAPGLNVTPSPFFVEDLKNNRSDNVSLLNFRVDKGFTFAGHYKVTGIFDLYNVTNANPVTNFSLANGNFRSIIAVLDPRVAQVAIRFEF